MSESARDKLFELGLTVYEVDIVLEQHAKELEKKALVFAEQENNLLKGTEAARYVEGIRDTASLIARG